MGDNGVIRRFQGNDDDTAAIVAIDVAVDDHKLEHKSKHKGARKGRLYKACFLWLAMLLSVLVLVNRWQESYLGTSSNNGQVGCPKTGRG